MNSSSEEMLDFLNNAKSEQDIFNICLGNLPEAYKQSTSDILEEIEIESFEELVEIFGPQTIGEHEVMDRTMLLRDNLENFICGHPAILANERAFRLASIAREFLQELQECLMKSHIDEECSDLDNSDLEE